MTPITVSTISQSRCYYIHITKWRKIWEGLKKVPAWTLLIFAAISLLIWLRSCHELVSEVRIATASTGGQYHALANQLAPLISERARRSVELVPTRGTVENVELLRQGKVQFAILQAGATGMDGLASVAPLYPDVVLVVVRRSSGITSVPGLAGRSIAVGPQGSGMRASAATLLGHYRVGLDSLSNSGHYFLDLLNDPSLEGAVITTGLLNPDLLKLLGTGEFVMLPVLDAEALALHYPYFRALSIPRGMYGENPPCPPVPVETVATTAFIGCREDTPSFLVIAVLEALYRDYPPNSVPTIIPAHQAQGWLTIAQHPSAYAFNNPFESLGLITNFMESLAAFKELLFALGAGFYLVWLRIRALRNRKRTQLLHQQREHLDDLLNETVRIERAQMGTNTLEELNQYLDEVTLIKLSALDELTHEDLRGDQKFQIFLMQCANLIRKIQSKIAVHP